MSVMTTNQASFQSDNFAVLVEDLEIQGCELILEGSENYEEAIGLWRQAMELRENWPAKETLNDGVFSEIPEICTVEDLEIIRKHEYLLLYQCGVKLESIIGISEAYFLEASIRLAELFDDIQHGTTSIQIYWTLITKCLAEWSDMQVNDVSLHLISVVKTCMATEPKLVSECLSDLLEVFAKVMLGEKLHISSNAFEPNIKMLHFIEFYVLLSSMKSSSDSSLTSDSKHGVEGELDYVESPTNTEPDTHLAKLLLNRKGSWLLYPFLHTIIGHDRITSEEKLFCIRAFVSTDNQVLHNYRYLMFATPLHMACYRKYYSFEIVKALLEYGFDLHDVNALHLKPLDYLSFHSGKEDIENYLALKNE